MNLLKKLFAIFTVASMVLACLAKPFLMLLALGADKDDSMEPSHRISSGFNSNSYNCSGYNCNGFTRSGDWDC